MLLLLLNIFILTVFLRWKLLTDVVALKLWPIFYFPEKLSSEPSQTREQANQALQDN